MEKLYYTAKEVAEMLDVSVSHAYKVIREANRELSSKGFYVRAGRVSRKYLDSKVYDLCFSVSLAWVMMSWTIWVVLYASLREKGRKKKVKIVQYHGRVGKGSFYK